MQIYSFNNDPRNMWDDIPVRPYNGKKPGEYITELSSSFNQKDSIDSHEFKIYNAPQQNSIEQVVGAKAEWQKAVDIFSGKRNGKFIGFDLETLGSINPNDAIKMSAITEFGMGSRTYTNGQLIDSEYISYAIGIDKQQTEELNKLATKFRTNGMSALDSAEQSTIKRLSMIGSKGNFYDVFTPIQDKEFGTMWTVKELGEATLDYDDIVRGIKYENELYYLKGAKSKDYIPKLVKRFKEQSNNSLIYGANSQYDYSWLEKATGENFDKYLEKTLDVTNAVRTVAAEKQQSVLSHFNQNFGRTPAHTEQAASMDNMLGVFGINAKQLHTAGLDVFNEGEILAFKNYTREHQGYKSFAEVVTEAANSDIAKYKTVNLDKSVFLFNRGKMDLSKSDYAEINGEVIPQGYSMSNDYWTIDTKRTGTYSVKMPNEDNPTDRFIAVYSNTAEPNVVIRKEYDSQESFIDDLRRNTNQISKSDITSDQIKRQHRIAIQDRGRREFEKGINYRDVRTNNGKDANGIQELLKDIDNLKIIEKDKNFKSHRYSKELYNIVENHKDELNLTSPYQIQSYAGSAERMSNESELIKRISDQIDNQYKDADNLSKTIMFEQAYNGVQEKIREVGYKGAEDIAQQNPTYTVSDVFGVDLQIKDFGTDEISVKRVNTQNIESARIDTGRIFNGITKEQARWTIDDLYDREVITKSVHNKLIKSLNLNYQPNQGSYNLSVDVATELNDLTNMFKVSYASKDTVIDEFNTIKNYTVKDKYGNPLSYIPKNSPKVRLFENGEFTRDNIVAIKNKNLKAIGNYQIANARGIVQDTNGKNHYINELLSNDPKFSKMVNRTINKTLKSVNELRDDVSLEKISLSLADQLNLQTETSKDILYEMFGSSDKKKSYALNNPYNDLRQFVISPDKDIKGNSFVIITNDKHVNDVQNILMNQKKEIQKNIEDPHNSSYQYLNELFEDNASVIELHKTNSLPLNDVYDYEVSKFLNSTKKYDNINPEVNLKSISQGQIEKFIIPSVEIYKNKDGKINMKVTDSEERLLSAYRMKSAQFLERVRNNDFGGAASLIRKAQNEVLTDLSSPSSYRGRKMPDGTIQRIANYHPADIMNAYDINIKGIVDLLKEMGAESTTENNAVQKMLLQFNNENQIISEKALKNIADPSGRFNVYSRLIDSPEFSEYFARHIFRGKNSILDAMIETANGNEEYYHDSVRTILENLKELPIKNQLLPDSAIKHKDKRILISVKLPGEFSNMQGLFSTMRPTYTQQNRPMYFTEKDFVALGKMSGGFLDNGFTRIGQSSYSESEFLFNQIIPERIKSITTRFRQMNDADLADKYKFYLDSVDNLDFLAKNIMRKNPNINKDTVKKTIEYFSAEMSNVFEGKWYMDPIFSATPFITDIDPKKINPFDPSEINTKATSKYFSKILKNKKGSIIHTGDKIGLSSNNTPILYEGPDFELTKQTAKQLLNYGESYVFPIQSSVSDIKAMMASEKATLHTINMQEFMKYTGITDNDEALNVAHNVFQDLFEATVIGNIKSGKHNVNYATYSDWNVIETYFKATDNLELLLNLTEDIPEFQDMHLRIENNELIMDTTRSKHLVQAVEKFKNKLNDELIDWGNKKQSPIYDLYNNILGDIEYYHDMGIIYGQIQRSHMNEHLSEMFKMDVRVEQSARLRNQEFYELNKKTADDKYLDAFKKKAMSERLGEAYQKIDADIFQAISDQDSMNVVTNKKAKRYNFAAKRRQEDIKGVLQAREFLFTGKKPENIVTITLDDLKGSNKKRIIPKNATVDDLKNFIFSVDGRPSDFIKRLAKDQNVLLDKGSYSIYFDFGQKVELIVGKEKRKMEYTGIVLPRLNVLTSTSGQEEFFIDSQRNVTQLMNSVLDYVEKEPGYKELPTIIQNYADKVMLNTQLLNSDSDLYKAVGRWAMPNSGQFQAQDEVPALFDEFFQEKVIEKYKQRKELIKNISENLNPKDIKNTVDQYNSLTEQINKSLEKVATEIETADHLPEFTSIKNLNKINKSKISSIIKINGKETYNNVSYIGREGFKELGLDFRKVGMDLLYYQQSGEKDIVMGMNDGTFSISTKEIQIISDKINQMNLGFTISPNEKNLVTTLNDELKKKYKLDPDKAFTIKDLNKKLSQKKRKQINAIYDVFEEIGERYITEVGVLSEGGRYPYFNAEPAENIRLDTTIRGKQKRYGNPLFSDRINVDFDGDTGFNSLILNGNSISTFDDSVFRNLHTSWQQSMSTNRQEIADLVRKGDALNADRIEDVANSYANMLKSFKEDEYWKAVDEFISNKAPDFKDYSHAELEENAGLMAIVHHSDEMAEAWNKSGFNTLTDSEVIEASMIPNIRKQGVGIFSIPNFNLRDTLFAVRNNKALSDEKRNSAIEILSDMANMKIKDHGLTGITEQKSIDVKHLIDAHKITKIPKWNTGMNLLFKRQATSKDKEQGMFNLIEASRNVLFEGYVDANGNAIPSEDIAKEILNTTRKEFLASGNDDKYTTYKRWLRGVYDASEIDEAVDVFTSSLKKGTLLDAYIDDIVNPQHGAYGTLIEKLNPLYKDIREGESLKYMQDGVHVYIAPGDMSGSMDRALVGMPIRNNRMALKEVDFQTGVTSKKPVHTVNAKTIKQANNQLDYLFKVAKDETPISMTIHDLVEKNDTYQEAIRIAQGKKVTSTIDNIISKNGLTKYENFLKLDSIHQLNYGLDNYKTVTGLFGDTVKAKEQIDKFNELSALYNRHTIGKKNGGIDPLIKNLNADIVANPGKYANTFYADNLEKIVAGKLGGTEVLEGLLEKQRLYGSILNRYDTAINSLNNGLYDIISERERLNVSFDSLDRMRQEVTGIEQIPNIDLNKAKTFIDDLDTRINDKQNIINTVIDSLKNDNINLIEKTQKEVYSLFKDQDQMRNFFNFANASGNTTVGFGSYMGVKFANLSKKDIKNVLDESNVIIQQNKATGLYADAVIQTQSSLLKFQALNKNKPNMQGMVARNFVENAEPVTNIINENIDIISNIKSLDLDEVQVEQVIQNAMNNTTKKTKKKLFDNEFFKSETLKNIATPKNIGIGLAGLAALGIVNNLSHREDKKQSPLTPAQNKRTSPKIMGNDRTAEMPDDEAPASGNLKRRTVYHDNDTGLNFNINAKTRKIINARGTSSMINNTVGGSTEYSITQDKSGITDNWLANKFVDLN